MKVKTDRFMWLKNILANKEQKQLLLLTLFIIIVTCGCFIYPSMPWGADMKFHLSRISSLRDAILLEYDFPIKIYPNYFNSNGYGNGLFYPDIFLYIPAYLAVLGCDIITTYKLLLLGCTIISIISMYKCSKLIIGNHKAALCCSLVYIMSGYRMYDIFIRGAIGEILSITFIPLVIYGLYNIIKGNIHKWPIFIIGFSSVLLSHIISSLLLIILLIIITLLNIKSLYKDRKRLYLLIGTIIGTFLITSYFYMPFIEQIVSDEFVLTNETVHYTIENTTLPISYLFLDLNLGYPVNPSNILSIKYISGIGIFSLISIILYIANINKYRHQNYFVFNLFIICILFTIPISNLFPWNHVLKIFPQLSAIQFSWRFNIINIFTYTIIIGFIYKNIQNYFKNCFKIILIYYSIVAIIHILIPYTFFIYSEYLGGNTRFDKYVVSGGEYLPIEASRIDLDNYQHNKNIITSFTQIKDTYQISYTIDNNSNHIELPILFYKGYKAYNDNQIIPIYKTKNGMIGISPTKKSATIVITYRGTFIQRIFNSLSLFSIICIIILIYYQKSSNKLQKNNVIRSLK